MRKSLKPYLKGIRKNLVLCARPNMAKTVVTAGHLPLVPSREFGSAIESPLFVAALSQDHTPFPINVPALVRLYNQALFPRISSLPSTSLQLYIQLDFSISTSYLIQLTNGAWNTCCCFRSPRSRACPMYAFSFPSLDDSLTSPLKWSTHTNLPLETLTLFPTVHSVNGHSSPILHALESLPRISSASSQLQALNAPSQGCSSSRINHTSYTRNVYTFINDVFPMSSTPCPLASAFIKEKPRI